MSIDGQEIELLNVDIQHTTEVVGDDDFGNFPGSSELTMEIEFDWYKSPLDLNAMIGQMNDYTIVEEVYVLPKDRFITYEESDWPWLEYFGLLDTAVRTTKAKGFPTACKLDENGEFEMAIQLLPESIVSTVQCAE